MMRIPKANNSSQHPDFTSFDSLHTEGLFTLAVFSPELKDCSGQGVWWPSSIVLGGLDSRARQGPKYLSSSKLGSDSSPSSALFIHYLTQSSLAPLCVCSPLPQLLPNPFHSFLLLLSQGLILPPLTFHLMRAALTGCRTTRRRRRTFLAAQGSALCLPLHARQGSLGSGSPRFSATLHNRLLLVPSPAHSLQSSLQDGIAGKELRWWNCQHHIHGISMLRLPVYSDRGVEQLFPHF